MLGSATEVPMPSGAFSSGSNGQGAATPDVGTSNPKANAKTRANSTTGSDGAPNKKARPPKPEAARGLGNRIRYSHSLVHTKLLLTPNAALARAASSSFSSLGKTCPSSYSIGQVQRQAPRAKRFKCAPSHFSSIMGLLESGPRPYCQYCSLLESS